MALNTDKVAESTFQRLTIVSGLLILANLFSIYLVEQWLDENLGAGSWLYYWAFLVGLVNTALMLSMIFSVFGRIQMQKIMFVIGTGALIVEQIFLAFLIPPTHFA